LGGKLFEDRDEGEVQEESVGVGILSEVGEGQLNGFGVVAD
jgi:hypothetical protein